MLMWKIPNIKKKNQIPNHDQNQARNYILNGEIVQFISYTRRNKAQSIAPALFVFSDSNRK